MDTKEHTEDSAVRDVLATYFDALYEASPEKISAIFHPQALYATTDTEPPLFRDLATYLDVMRRRESPESRGEERRDVIDSIDFAGANTARAQVRCSIGGSDFVDFLTLVRDEGRWQIVAKVFQIKGGN